MLGLYKSFICILAWSGKTAVMGTKTYIRSIKSGDSNQLLTVYKDTKTLQFWELKDPKNFQQGPKTL